MTIQNIKKALEICSKDDGCRECPYYDYHRCDKVLLKDTLALINEQVVEQNQKYQEQRIKQAQIDVLNELKERIKTAIDTYFNLDGGGYYLAEDAIDDIDELIEEVQNGK